MKRKRRKGLPWRVIITLFVVMVMGISLSATPFKVAPAAKIPSPLAPIESPTPTITPEPVVLEIPDLRPPEVDTNVVEAIAKTVWGEARGCSPIEQAAVVWCILNRVDLAGDGNIMRVLLTPNQFHGYNANNPADPDIVALVTDVLTRWQIEKDCVGSVGRVLPADYLWFSGDGQHNYFRNQYRSSTYWDWSLPNPYETEVTVYE